MIICCFFGSDTSNLKLCGQFVRISYKSSCEPCNSSRCRCGMLDFSICQIPTYSLPSFYLAGGGGGGEEYNNRCII